MTLGQVHWSKFSGMQYLVRLSPYAAVLAAEHHLGPTSNWKCFVVLLQMRTSRNVVLHGHPV